ncbi:MAG: hypothetical protein ACJ8LD_19045 [Pantoea agglomerans]
MMGDIHRTSLFTRGPVSMIGYFPLITQPEIIQFSDHPKLFCFSGYFDVQQFDEIFYEKFSCDYPQEIRHAVTKRKTG